MPAAKSETPEQTRRVLKPVTSDCVKLAQYSFNVWQAHCDASLTAEDLEVPELWQLNVHFRRGDVVNCFHGDNFTQCVVSDAGPGFAQLNVLVTRKLPPLRDAGALALPTGYSIRRALPEDKAVAGYLIVRDKDQHIMNRDQAHHSFEDARNYLLNHNAVRVGARSNRPY